MSDSYKQSSANCLHKDITSIPVTWNSGNGQSKVITDIRFMLAGEG